MWEKVDNPRTISLVVNGEEYEEFREIIRKEKGTTVGEYLRKVMREEVELQKKEKALNSPNYSPIKEPIINKPIETIKHNATLDIYLLEKKDIVKYLEKIEDIRTLADLENKGKLINTISRKRKFDRINIENTIKYIEKKGR